MGVLPPSVQPGPWDSAPSTRHPPPHLAPLAPPWYRNKIGISVTMHEEPQKQVSPDPAKPADSATTDASSEPEQVIRPEDEAVVVERLRELGYIE